MMTEENGDKAQRDKAGDVRVASTQKRHVVFVQYGDYREAVYRFAAGGEETYNSQLHSVEHVASLVRGGEVTVICLPALGAEEVLPNGVRAIGLGQYTRGRSLVLCATLERLRPSHLLVLTPHLPAIAWGLARGVRVLPIFADSFQRRSSRKKRWEQALLVRLLNRRAIDFVANHNVPACLDLEKIGVDRDKILPWDWPAHNRPEESPAKAFPDPSLPIRVFFAGAVTEAKGVGDLIRAIPIFQVSGRQLEVTIAGDGGERAALESLARSLGLSEQVRFLGRIPQNQVFQCMRSHDFVVVPSRHEYPEGMPMTIYEALASRTPLLVSDHPMIAPALAGKPGVNVFRASAPDDLARVLLRVASDRRLYEEASHHAIDVWHSIQVPLKRSDLIDHWLGATPEHQRELRRYVLAANPLGST
jgi:glycosyltransferase involved in cell wall biosynthesis